MAGDFRTTLYRHYVSAFKRAKSAKTAKTAKTDAQTSSFTWWDHKYLPLLAGLDRSAPLLEVGCGAGSLLVYLERRGFSHVRGVDISAEQIELARSRGVHAELGNLFDVLERSERRWQAIIAVDVLEHFSRDELVHLAPALYTALRPGGRLLIQTANGAGLFPGQVIYGDLTHLTIFSPPSLAQLLRPVGFTDFAFYETGPIPIRLRGRLDVALWRALTTLVKTARYVETGKRQSIWTENFICQAFRPPQA